MTTNTYETTDYCKTDSVLKEFDRFADSIMRGVKIFCTCNAKATGAAWSPACRLTLLRRMRALRITTEQASGGGFCLLMNGVDIGWHNSRRSAIKLASKIVGRKN
jgi:hypothetical protein